MEKILFLDIDGVLNSEKYFIEREKKVIDDTEDYLIYNLDPEKVEMINRIIVATGCEIVLSSSWRVLGMERVNTALQKAGMKGDIKYRTSIHKDKRGEQIKEFIQDNDVRKFIILDDEGFDIREYFNTEEFVKTTWEDGLEEKHVEYIIDYFGRG